MLNVKLLALAVIEQAVRDAQLPKELPSRGTTRKELDRFYHMQEIVLHRSTAHAFLSSEDLSAWCSIADVDPQAIRETVR